MQISAYKEKIKFFDDQAAGWYFPGSDRIQTEKILRSINLPKDGIILDAGCGTGNLFPILKEVVPKAMIVACDLSRRMLIECRSRFIEQLVPVWAGYCEDMPLKNASIDLVLNYCVFPHIKNSRKALMEYHRILKPGGGLLIIHPHGREEINTKHRRIGFPVSDDLLPPAAEIVTLLARHSFLIRQVIDRADLYLIEAGK